jgi:uncharacterized protein YdhG (YjbR/CyaY superfamily)
MKLRRAIRAAAPDATEGISYGMATFKHNGKRLLHFAYWKNHIALYGMSSRFIKAHTAELKAFDLSKGTLRVSVDHPLPDRLVTQMVKTRIAEIEKGGA